MLTRTTPLRAKAPIRSASRKRIAHRASDEGKAGLAHMARVRALPCVICHEWEHRQTSPSEAHHVIHGRYSARKSPDIMTLPLCRQHHRESDEIGKVALHQSPTEWKRLHGLDVDWLSWVEHRIGDDT